MSNGVGIIAGLSGSVPRIVSPRPSPPESDRLNPPGRPIRTSEEVRRPVRSSAASMSPARPAAAPGVPSRTLRTAAVTGPTRGAVVPTGSTPPAAGVVRRIAESFRSIPLRDGSRIRLSLHPATLGDLRIELSVAGSRLRARVWTETEEARDLILSSLDDLRRNLAGRGIRISRFDVEVGARPEGEAGREKPGLKSHRRQVLDLEA